jgi:hypothetical protein
MSWKLRWERAAWEKCTDAQMRDSRPQHRSTPCDETRRVDACGPGMRDAWEIGGIQVRGIPGGLPYLIERSAGVQEARPARSRL